MPQKRKELKIGGVNLWYLVGLIASEGCLSKDGRHIDITSKDYGFLKNITDHYGLTNKVCKKYNSTGGLYYHFQLANRYFYDFLRGIIDGDGGIQRWINRSNGKEQWSLRASSGSRIFLKWLQDKIETAVGVKGKIYCQLRNQFRLKYGKMAAKEIIKRCYYQNCVGMDRKVKLASECWIRLRAGAKAEQFLIKYRRGVGTGRQW
ncbi:MAG: hypothetical protein ACOY3D_08035, partial [Candidatus Omnitrophota bacterium]